MVTIEMMNVILEDKNEQVLSIDNLVIREGRIVGVVGARGAGKSEFLELIAGIRRPTSGQVIENGQKVYDNSRLIKDILHISDSKVFAWYKSIKSIAADMSKKYPNFDTSGFEIMLETFEIPPKTKYSSLNRQLQVTVNFMLGISARCPITIYDQPLRQIPVKYRKELYALLSKDHAAWPRTVFLASNLALDINQVIQEVIYLYNGEMLFHSSINDVEDYAIYLYGRKDAIKRIIGDKEYFYSKDFNEDNYQVLIKNDLTALQNRQLLVEDVNQQHVGLVSFHSYMVKGALEEMEDLDVNNSL